MMPLGECDYQLTIAYDIDPDGSSLDDEINHLQMELFNVSESYRCSIEADIREVDGQQRSW
jgi:predicted metal-dependent peptidase